MTFNNSSLTEFNNHLSTLTNTLDYLDGLMNDGLLPYDKYMSNAKTAVLEFTTALEVLADKQRVHELLEQLGARNQNVIFEL